MYILGDVFLRGWYSVYDYENKQMGLALNIDSTCEVITEAPSAIFRLIILSIGLIVMAMGLKVRKEHNERKFINYDTTVSLLPWKDNKPRPR